MLRRPAIAQTPYQRQLGVALLVLALLWAQVLGLAHGVLHAGWAPSGSATELSAPAAPAAGLWAHLTAPTGDDNDCRLYDQLGHGGPGLQLPALPAAALPLLAAGPVLLPLVRQHCAAFEARGPPLSR